MIRQFGERAFIAEFQNFKNDVESGLYANEVAKVIRDHHGIEDAVVGINSVTLRFDATRLTAEKAKQILSDAIAVTPANVSLTPSKKIEIPVCYGGEFGPDLEDLCTNLGMTPQTFISTHASDAYRVITLGFSPGFAYLGELDKRLRAPRLETPRAHVEAGSIGIAGAYTGIYSVASPGGWRIIARTPLSLFDAALKNPFLFEAGVEIRFKAITPDEYTAIKQKSS